MFGAQSHHPRGSSKGGVQTHERGLGGWRLKMATSAETACPRSSSAFPRISPSAGRPATGQRRLCFLDAIVETSRHDLVKQAASLPFVRFDIPAEHRDAC